MEVEFFYRCPTCGRLCPKEEKKHKCIDGSQVDNDRFHHPDAIRRMIDGELQ